MLLVYGKRRVAGFLEARGLGLNGSPNWIGMSPKTQRSDMNLPATLDAARSVVERRLFEGSLPLAGMSRLADSLADNAGEVRYKLEFGAGELGDRELHVQAEAELALQCQRTLETFLHHVRVDTRLGLIDNERQEAGLPQDVEPLLLDDGLLRPAAVIEDELLLALPLVPVKPGSRLPELDAGDMPADEADERYNPFAVLGKLKQNK